MSPEARGESEASRADPTPRDTFEARIERLEREAQEQPFLYKVKLFLLALLGYLYILAVLLLLVGGVLLLVALVANIHGFAYMAGKLGWVLVVLIWLICRSLWITVPEPAGVEVTPGQAPELFRRIDRLRQALDGPSIAAVVIAPDFNASITQVPRLGILGWPRNVLTIGWPLVLALGTAECEAVLAHEFGHLSAAHGRFAVWIYRIRSTWFALMESLERESGMGSFLFARFFRWYAPVFGAFSFVLARRHEFDADRLGAAVVGPVAAGRALVDTSLWHVAMDELFWTQFQARSRVSADPPSDFCRSMEAFFRQPLPPGRVAHWLRMSLQVKTTGDDTHPALRDRLQALGIEAAPPLPVEVPAVCELFPAEVRETIAARLDAEWRERVGETWRHAHEEYQWQVKRLEEIRSQAGERELSLPERLDRAFLTEIVEGSAAALPLFEPLFAEHPDLPVLTYTRARFLLEAGDEAGVSLMERAIAMDPEHALQACDLVIRFLIEQERREEADPWIHRARAVAEMIERDREERRVLPFAGVYRPHGADSAVISGIAAAIRRHPEVCEAYLVQRILTVFPERPLFVLGIRLKRKWTQMDGDLAAPAEVICQELAALPIYPGEVSILHLHGVNARLFEIFNAIEGARIDLGQG